MATATGPRERQPNQCDRIWSSDRRRDSCGVSRVVAGAVIVPHASAIRINGVCALQKQCVLVLFEPVPGGAAREAELPDPVLEGDTRTARQIARLKQQLADAKERYLSTIEAHQTSREESQN